MQTPKVPTGRAIARPEYLPKVRTDFAPRVVVLKSVKTGLWVSFSSKVYQISILTRAVELAALIDKVYSWF